MRVAARTAIDGERQMKWNVGTKIGSGFTLAMMILVAIGFVPPKHGQACRNRKVGDPYP